MGGVDSGMVACRFLKGRGYIMSPKFMSGALRSHKQTQFSRGGGLTASPNPQVVLMARYARQ